MLVALVRGVALADNESRDFRAEDHWGPNWPKEVDLVTAIVLPGAGPPEWGGSDSGSVGFTNRELIQNALDRKESSCASFSEKIQGRWLLLVCDGSVESSMLGLHEGVGAQTYRSSYDHAFVMDFSGRVVVELAIEQQ